MNLETKEDARCGINVLDNMSSGVELRKLKALLKLKCGGLEGELSLCQELVL